MLFRGMSSYPPRFDTKDHKFAGSEFGRQRRFREAKVTTRDDRDQSAPDTTAKPSLRADCPLRRKMRGIFLHQVTVLSGI